MKKSVIIAVCLVIAILTGVYFLQTDTPVENKLWEGADYTQNTELGNGEKTVEVEVQAEGKSVTFTVHTDKTTVGEALKEHKLIDGEEGPYGLFVKVVNGIKADYDEDKSYWSFYKNGEAMKTGVDGTELTDGEHYEIIYTR